MIVPDRSATRPTQEAERPGPAPNADPPCAPGAAQAPRSGRDPGSSSYRWCDARAAASHAYLARKVMTALPRPPARIVDLGCGNGYLSGTLSRLGYSVVGVESSRDGVEIARAAYPSIEFLHASVYDPLCDRAGAPFDAAVATEVIEHLFDPKAFLENAFRHLRPGGCLVLSTPFHGYLKNLAIGVIGGWDAHFTANWLGGHIKFFSPKTIERMLLDVGFDDVRFRFAGRLPLLWKSMIVRAVRPVPRPRERE